MGCHIYIYEMHEGMKRERQDIPWIRLPAVFYDKKFTNREAALKVLEDIKACRGTCPDTDSSRIEVCCTQPCFFSHRFPFTEEWLQSHERRVDEIIAAVKEDNFVEMQTG